MEMQKMVLLIIFVVVSIAISLLVIQLLLGNAKSRNDEAGNLRTSYVLLFSSTFISAAFILNKCTISLFTVIDVVGKVEPTKVLLEILKISAVFIGLSMIWLIIWYYVTYILARMIAGKRNESYELKNNNISHFIFRGCLLLGTVVAVSTIFEMLLKTFIPAVEVPFYH